jgi:hypothetical protein
MAAKRNDDRKQVAELITQYKLHPELRDIYVEGSWDKGLVEWVVRTAGITEFVVYDVDTVFIPSEVLAKHGFNEGQHGKKERVVTLAFELQDHVKNESQVSCLADRDYDTLLGRNYKSPLLLMTDFSCQEMYFLNEEVIGKFLALVVGCPVTPRDFLNNLLEILQELHLIRATNVDLKWGIQWLAPGKACGMEGNALRFRRQEYMEKYLSKGARLGQKSEFLEKREELRGRMTNNPLNHVSKNDLFTLLAEILPRFCDETAMHQEKFIARSLAGCIEHRDLVAQPMYAALLNRLGASIDDTGA